MKELCDIHKDLIDDNREDIKELREALAENTTADTQLRQEFVNLTERVERGECNMKTLTKTLLGVAAGIFAFIGWLIPNWETVKNLVK